MVEDIESKSTKDSNRTKFLWNLLDRVMFIGIGAVGAVATSYFTGILKLNPPELAAEASFVSVDSNTPVASNVGGIKLDYKEEKASPYGILRVDIKNGGRGGAENVRFQVKLPAELKAAYEVEPDFKVYLPTVATFSPTEYYTALSHFPSGAEDFLALRITGEAKELCSARIKLVNDEYEGKVGAIKGTGGCE